MTSIRKPLIPEIKQEAKTDVKLLELRCNEIKRRLDASRNTPSFEIFNFDPESFAKCPEQGARFEGLLDIYFNTLNLKRVANLTEMVNNFLRSANEVHALDPQKAQLITSYNLFAKTIKEQTEKIEKLRSVVRRTMTQQDLDALDEKVKEENVAAGIFSPSSKKRF